MNGHIALYRKLLDNPVVCKDADHLAVWIYLLGMAVWKPKDVMFHGEKITLMPGQLTTGRKVIADKFKISESKVQRILKLFESEHQIEQRTDRQCRLITIVSWNKYQQGEQRNEHQVNNDRTTSEQRVNTKEEYKNINKGNKGNKYIAHERNIIPPTLEMVQDYISNRGSTVNAQQFMDFYDSKGWFVGKNKMKDWQAAVRTWERQGNSKPKRNPNTNPFTEMLRTGDY